MPITLGRNDDCHCGSGKKYKKCHLEKDETADRKDREKAALNAAKVAAESAEKDIQSGSTKSNPNKSSVPARGGWVQKMAGKVGFFRNLTQRRAPPANKGG